MVGITGFYPEIVQHFIIIIRKNDYYRDTFTSTWFSKYDKFKPQVKMEVILKVYIVMIFTLCLTCTRTCLQ